MAREIKRSSIIIPVRAHGTDNYAVDCNRLNCRVTVSALWVGADAPARSSHTANAELTFTVNQSLGLINLR